MSHFTLEFVAEQDRTLTQNFPKSVLKVEHVFELQNLFSLRFTDSEICLPLFDFETKPEHKKRTRICL